MEGLASAAGSSGGGTPWGAIIKGGSQVLDGQQSGGSGKAGSNGKGSGGVLQTIGQRSNMPKQATMGLASGLIQSIQAANLKRKAEAAFPELVDPNQSAYLSELNQKRKSIETGADFATGMRAIDTTNAGTNNAIVSAGGGDAGGTIQALLQSENVAQTAKDNVLAQGQSEQQYYNGAYGSMLDKISGRKMQLQLLRSQQARAEWDHKSKLAGANLAAGVAGLMEQKQDYNKPNMGATSNSSAGEAGGAPGISSATPASNFPSDWNYKGAQPSQVPTNPNPAPATSIETTGVQNPGVVPQNTMATDKLGPVMNLLKK